MSHHRTCRVEHHRVTHGPLLAAEHRSHRRRVGLRVTTHQLGQLGAAEPERGRVERQPLDGARLHTPDGARGGGGQLVETVVTVYNQDAGSTSGEHTGQHLGQVPPRAADETGPRRRRIGQRAKQIEDRRHPDLATHDTCVPIRRVKLRRETETDADLGDAACDVIGTQIDAHPERLERVGSARQRRRGPVAVLDHRHAGRGHHDGRHRGQVHRVGAVASGADHIDGLVSDRLRGHPPRVLEHGVGQLSHLCGGRELHLHRHAKGGDLGWSRYAGHDLVHRPAGLTGRERLTSGEAAEDLGPRWGVGGSHAPIMTNCSPGWSSTTTKRHTCGVTSAVSTSGTAITSRVHSLNRPNMVSVGTIVWLSSELMFFAGLFAMYFTARSQAGGEWPPPPTELNLVQAVPVTLVLIASSFTCQMGVFAAERGDVFGLRRWYVITFLMGLFFVLGQGYEYLHLVAYGTTIPGSAYGSVFYLATGFHGLHVIGGLIAFIFLLARTTMSKFTPAQATAAIVVSYYWHFVDIVWIALFATIYFVR